MATRRSTLIANRVGAADRPSEAIGPGWSWLPAAVLAVALLFAVAPWPLEHKAHVLLHGLCAQIPSHTFHLGERALPFDARMTGIYGGFLTSMVGLLARGRLRAFRMPPRRVSSLLGLGVGVMAIDGSNSLLRDLRLPHLYAPENWLRLVTGTLTGIALATMLAFVVATTLWREGRWDLAPIGGVAELAGLVLLATPFVGVVLHGGDRLYVPVVAFLLAAAVGVVSMLVLVVVVLVHHGDRRFERAAQLDGAAAGAMLLAVVVMAAFAGGRFLLERIVGAPPLT